LKKQINQKPLEAKNQTAYTDCTTSAMATCAGGMADKLFITIRFSAQTWLILSIYKYIIEIYSW
jgi:hypothetical protein